MQEAVLGLVVDAPRYGYLIAQELEAEHAKTAIYESIKRLLDLGMIERVDMPEARRERKWYQATARGRVRHAKLVARALQQRDDLLGRLRKSPIDGLAPILDEYEALLHRQIQGDLGDGEGLVERLLAREREKVLEARLDWLAEAREMIANGLSTT